MLETGANIATIFLILEFLVVVFVVLAVVIALTVGTQRTRRKIEEVMPAVQGKARQLSSTTENVSQKVASPFIRFQASQARFHGMRERVFHGSSAQPGGQQQDTKEE